MANKEYYGRWLEFKNVFSTTLAADANLQDLAVKQIGIKSQPTAVEIVARVYCKYCELYNKLCDIYDQMEQPQRQEYIKKIIDALTCRLIELKMTLEEVEVFEYTYADNALQQLLMVPQDIQIMCPFFYSFETRQVELQYIVDQIFAGNRLGDPEPTPSEKERLEEERLEQERIKQEEKDAEILRKLAMGEDIPASETSVIYTPEELERMRSEEEHKNHLENIQRMERSRKIVLFNVQNANKQRNLYLELAGLKAPQAKEALKKKSASFIQKIYRRFMEIKRNQIRDYHLKNKLGMVIPSYEPVSAKLHLEKVKEARRKFRREYHRQWMNEHVKEKSRIFKLRQGDIMEDISDEIRQWFREWYIETRAFDDFPWPDEGGSILVVKGETFTTDEYIEWVKAEEKRLKKEAQSPKSKEDIKQEKIAAREEKKRLAAEANLREKKRIQEYKKMRLNPDSDPGVYVTIGKCVDPLQNEWFRYENVWLEIDVPNAALNVIKGYIKELIVENVYQELQYELRPIVDEMMRMELNLLRSSLKIDCALAEVPMPMVKKRKKPKKVKPPKPEKTPPEVLFQRLVDGGIVVKYPSKTLDDYWGERNYAAADLRAIPWTPIFSPPCMGDVMEQVRVRCLLTLGSSCPKAVRTQLIVGPKGAGKRTLIYAIASETNSILIDLSPMNIYNKFPGAKGLKTMLNLVNKVSRIMQPTIILVNNADKLFYKKVPKEEKEFDPTRLSKDFFKELVKPLKASDKVMIIGTASEPWLSNKATMFKAFPSLILLPRTDYASISFILTKSLMKYHGVDREFNVHSVAQSLRGYDINTIRKAINNLLNGKRIAELGYKPLQPLEVVSAVIENEEAIYTEEWDYDQFKQWYLTYSPWGAKYLEYMIMLDKQLEMKLKADKKKKK